MLFRQIFDERLAQYAYLVGCQMTKEALVIDPERDIDRYVDIATAEGLTITAVAETHIHADFLSGSREFAERYGTTVYASDEGDADWKYEWLKGSRYKYRLLKDGDTFQVGNIEIKAVHTPGHTPEHLSYMIVDKGGQADEPMGLVTGDFVFVGDVGRPDLLESAAGIEGVMRPSAQRLFLSVRHFLDLPDFLQIWPGHGAGSACGKALGAVPTTTVGYERRFNEAIKKAKEGETAFVDAILEGQPEPPLYFARMKHLNKVGPPVLGTLPSPRAVTAQELAGLTGRHDLVVVDTRADRAEFMRGHLPGSLYAPLDKSFPTVVGSYVEPDTPIYLIVEPQMAETAVRNLVRIGLDRVEGRIAPSALAEYAAQGGHLRETTMTDFSHLAATRQKPNVVVLDVRNRSEYVTGHVPGATNIAHTRLFARRDEIPHDKLIAVHCQGGGRAAAAGALLERHGFNVVVVDDEFEKWSNPEGATVQPS